MLSVTSLFRGVLKENRLQESKTKIAVEASVLPGS